MNWAAEALAIRQQRDVTVQEVTEQARRRLAELTVQRDREIHRLAAQGWSTHAIAPVVGCSQGTAYDVLHPGRPARLIAQRRQRLRAYDGGRAA